MADLHLSQRLRGRFQCSVSSLQLLPSALHILGMSVLKRLHLLLHSSQLQAHTLLLLRLADRQSVYLLPQLLVAGPLGFELVALLLQILG